MKWLIPYCLLFTLTSSLDLAAAGKARQLFSAKETVDEVVEEKEETDPLSLRQELRSALDAAMQVYRDKGADDTLFVNAVEKTKELRRKLYASQIKANQEQQSELAIPDFAESMDRTEISLQELLLEWGPTDFVYLISPEIASSKIHIASNLSMPKESWGDLVEALLAQNGLGVKKIHPLAKQIFPLKQELHFIEAICTRKEELELFDKSSRLLFLLNPPPERARAVQNLLEKIIDPKTCMLYSIGNRVGILANGEEIGKLISVYERVWTQGSEKIVKWLSISKLSISEMEKILSMFFGDASDKLKPAFGKFEIEPLSIFPLLHRNALVLIGEKNVVERAEKIAQEIQKQIEDPKEMGVFLYECLHSDPNDLSKILENVYDSLLSGGSVDEPRETYEYKAEVGASGGRAPDGYAPNQPLMIAPEPAKTTASSRMEIEKGFQHFIPEVKTGTILMVIRKDTHVALKQLLKKLDIPKKMVQIEVLLFEKKIRNQNNFGLNLLKLGSDTNGVNFQSGNNPSGFGVFQFFLSGSKSKYFPAYDIAYNFLMSQEDIQLNAAPSVITINQTPAKIAIQEEISINNGAAPVNTSSGNISYEKSYSRANYGIALVFTPTVHKIEDDQGEQKGCITLKTNITFDTTKSTKDDRPTIERRHIENEVRVMDGQTVVIGGLRRKTSHENVETVPFLGELPFLGSFFKSTEMHDSLTEMFFFITPKLLSDSQEQMEQATREELSKRPGDIPEVLQEIEKLQEKRKAATMLQLFFQAG